MHPCLLRSTHFVTITVGWALDSLFFPPLTQASTFRHVSEIPQKFLSSHVTLQGHVQDVSTLGVLHVRHQPVFSLPFSSWVHRLRAGDQGKGKRILSETFLLLFHVFNSLDGLVAVMTLLGITAVKMSDRGFISSTGSAYMMLLVIVANSA